MYHASHVSPNPSALPLIHKVQHDRHKQRRAENARAPLIIVPSRLSRPDGVAAVDVNHHGIPQGEEGQEGEHAGGDDGASATALVAGAKVEQSDGYGADVDGVFELLNILVSSCGLETGGKARKRRKRRK